MYFLFLPLSFLIPSSSGLATVAMPIMAPLASFADVPAYLVVTAYQTANGLLNLITPTSAVVMGGLAIARVGYGTWLKFVWPLLLGLAAMSIVVLIGRVAARVSTPDFILIRSHPSPRHEEVGDGCTDRAAGTASSAATGPAWHTFRRQDAAAQQKVEPSRGLSASEVDARRATYGPNAFAKADKEPTWQAFLRQYRDLMQIVLLGAAIVSFVFVREGGTTILLLGLTILNAAMGLNQEGKAVGERRSAPADDDRRDPRPPRRAAGRRCPPSSSCPGDIVALEAAIASRPTAGSSRRRPWRSTSRR